MIDQEIYNFTPVPGHQPYNNLPLKGLGNIAQMRDSGAKVVTSMLDVQLKII